MGSGWVPAEIGPTLSYLLFTASVIFGPFCKRWHKHQIKIIILLVTCVLLGSFSSRAAAEIQYLVPALFEIRTRRLAAKFGKATRMFSSDSDCIVLLLCSP